jgi:hypothetical protein
MMWADDGTIWLLPGYTFQSTDGGIYSVLAVPDEFVQQAQPDLLPLDTLPVDTVVIDTVPVDTVPLDTVPVDAVEPTPVDTQPVGG